MANEYDFSNMSNEELEKLAAMAPDEQEPAAEEENEFANMSNEELERLAAMAPTEYEGEKREDYGIADRLRDQWTAETGRDYSGGLNTAAGAINKVAPLAGDAEKWRVNEEDKQGEWFLDNKNWEEFKKQYGTATDESMRGHKKREIGAWEVFGDEAAHNLASTVTGIPLIGDAVKWVRGKVRNWWNDSAAQHLVDRAQDSGLDSEDVERGITYSQGDPKKMWDYFQEKIILKKGHEADLRGQSQANMQANPEGVLSKIATRTVNNIGYTANYLIGGSMGGIGEIMIPAALSAASRYGELTKSEFERTADGRLIRMVNPDTAGEAAFKAISGGLAEAAVEKVVGNWVDAGLGKMIGVVGGKTLGKLAKTEAGRALVDIAGNFKALGNLTGVNGIAGELVEEDVQAFNDDVLGLGKRRDEWGGVKQEAVNYWNTVLTTEGQLDTFYGLLGTMALQGGAALAKHQYDIANKGRLDDDTLRTMGVSDETIKQMTKRDKAFWYAMLTARRTEDVTIGEEGNEHEVGFVGKDGKFTTRKRAKYDFALTEEGINNLLKATELKLGRATANLYGKIANEIVRADNSGKWGGKVDENTMSEFEPPKNEDGSLKWFDAMWDKTGTMAKTLVDENSGITVRLAMPADAEGEGVYFVEDADGNACVAASESGAMAAADQLSRYGQTLRRQRGKKAQYIQQRHSEIAPGVNATIYNTMADAVAEHPEMAEQGGFRPDNQSVQFGDGSVAYILDNIGSIQEANAKVIHEAVVHSGLTKLVGSDNQARFDFLHNIDPKLMDDMLGAMAAQYGVSESELLTNPQYEVALEEAFAYTFEGALRSPTRAQLFIGKVRNGLRKLGVELPQNESDVVAMLRDLGLGVKQGSARVTRGAEAPRTFARPAETNEAQKATENGPASASKAEEGVSVPETPKAQETAPKAEPKKEAPKAPQVKAKLTKEERKKRLDEGKAAVSPEAFAAEDPRGELVVAFKDGILRVPKGYAQYRKTHNAWKRALKKGGEFTDGSGIKQTAMRENEPKPGTFGVKDEAVDFIDRYLDGDTGVRFRELFGANPKIGSNDEFWKGSHGEAVESMLNRAYEQGGIDAVVEEVLDARQAYQSWKDAKKESNQAERKAKAQADKAEANKAKEQAKAEEKAEEAHEDLHKVEELDFAEMAAWDEAARQAYYRAAGMIRKPGNAKYVSAFTAEELKKLEDFDTVEFDHAGEEFDFGGYDEKSGALEVWRYVGGVKHTYRITFTPDGFLDKIEEFDPATENKEAENEVEQGRTDGADGDRAGDAGSEESGERESTAGEVGEVQDEAGNRADEAPAKSVEGRKGKEAAGKAAKPAEAAAPAGEAADAGVVKKKLDTPIPSRQEAERLLTDIGYANLGYRGLSKVFTDDNGRKFVKYFASGNITPNIYLGETTPREVMEQFLVYGKEQELKLPKAIVDEYRKRKEEYRKLKAEIEDTEIANIKKWLKSENIPFSDVIDSERGFRIAFTDRRSESGYPMDWVDVADLDDAKERVDSIRETGREKRKSAAAERGGQNRKSEKSTKVLYAIGEEAETREGDEDTTPPKLTMPSGKMKVETVIALPDSWQKYSELQNRRVKVGSFQHGSPLDRQVKDELERMDADGWGDVYRAKMDWANANKKTRGKQPSDVPAAYAEWLEKYGLKDTDKNRKDWANKQKAKSERKTQEPKRVLKKPAKGRIVSQKEIEKELGKKPHPIHQEEAWETWMDTLSRFAGARTAEADMGEGHTIYVKSLPKNEEGESVGEEYTVDGEVSDVYTMGNYGDTRIFYIKWLGIGLDDGAQERVEKLLQEFLPQEVGKKGRPKRRTDGHSWDIDEAGPEFENFKDAYDFSRLPEVKKIIEAQKKQNGETRFSMVRPVERRKDLIAMHNVTAEGLRGMDELGGLAMPSFAITKDSMGNAEFGEISLLVRPATVNPKRGKNTIYSGDAWTPTFPETRVKLDEKVAERIANRGYEIFKKVPEWNEASRRGFGFSSLLNELDSSNINDYVNRYEGDVVSALKDKDAYKIMFLLDTGRTPKIVKTDSDLFVSGRGIFAPKGVVAWIHNPAVKVLSEKLGDRLLLNGKADAEKTGALAKDKELAKEIVGIIADAHPDGRGQVIKKHLLDDLEKMPMRPVDFYDISVAIAKYRRAGIPEEIDTGKTMQAVDEEIAKHETEYGAWLKNLTEGLTDGKRYVRNKRDRFTPSGNRRSFDALYDPLTLATAVKSMMEQQNQQGGGFLGLQPFGVAARKYKDLAEVIKDEGRLKTLTKEEKEALKDALTKKLLAVVEKYNKTKKSPDDNPFTQFGRASDMMLDSYTIARGNKARLLAELNSYGYTASEKLADEFLEVMREMSSMPEDYFEAKAYRAVGFDEIAAAVVPDNATAETKEIFARRGVPTYEYKADDKADRLRAVNEAADAGGIRFSAPMGRQKSATVIYPGAFDGTNPDIRFSTPRLYTGSAADYDKPSLHAVGTGEGAQVYGWGLYASNRRGVAEWYARKDVKEKRGGKIIGGTIFSGLQFSTPKDSSRLLLNGQEVNTPYDETDIKSVAEDIMRRFTPDEFREKLDHLKHGDPGILEELFAERLFGANWTEFDGEQEEFDQGIKEGLDYLREHGDEYTLVDISPKETLYEQTFFTNREPGDESHLLKWYEPVSEEQLKWIEEQAKKEGLTEKFENEKKWRGFDGSFRQFITDNGRTADAIYKQLSNSGLAHSDNKYRDTSEFLARAGIDGVKYPVDSYGKPTKDGDKTGWNYVSFRDDNIRVDHKWVDGQMRFSSPEWVSQNAEARLAQGWTFHPEGLTNDELNALAAVVPERHHTSEQTGSRTERSDTILEAMYPPNYADTYWPRFIKQFNGNKNALDRIRKALYLIYGGDTNNKARWTQLDVPQYSNLPEVDKAKEDARNAELYKQEMAAYKARQARNKEVGYPAYKDDVEWRRLDAEYNRIRQERLSPSTEQIAADNAMAELRAAHEATREARYAQYRAERIARGQAELARVAEEFGVEYQPGEARFSSPERGFGEETSIAKARIDEWRKARHMRELADAETRKDEKVAEEARAQYANVDEVNRLIETLNKSPRALTDTETLTINFRLNDLESKYSDLQYSASEAVSEGNQVQAKELQERAQFVLDEIDKCHKALRITGRMQALAFRMRRMLTGPGLTLAGLMAERKARLGRDLTAEETAQVMELARALKEANGKIDAEVVAAAVARYENEAKKILGMMPRPGSVKEVRELTKIDKAYEDALMIVEDHAQMAGGALIGLRNGKKLISDIMRYHRTHGIEGFDAVMAAVHRDLISRGITCSRSEILQMVSGYGISWRPDQSEVERDLRDMKQQALKLRQLEEIQLKLRAPLATGLQRDKPSDEVRRLEKQKRELMKELGIEETNSENRLRGALDSIKTRLRNQIADLESAIAKHEKMAPKSGSRVQYDEEANDLKARRDELRQAYDQIFPAEPLSLEERVRRARKRLDETLAKVEQELKDAEQGIFKGKQKREELPAPELDRKRREIENRRREIKEWKKRYFPDGTPEEMAERIQRRITALNNSIAMWQQKEMTGDFKPQEKRKPITNAKIAQLEKERKAIYEKILAMRRADERSRQPFGKVRDWLDVINATPRVLKTMLDLSATLMQGAWEVMAHPRLGVDALIKSVRAFYSADNATAIAAALKQDAAYEDFKQAGGHIYSQEDYDMQGVPEEFRASKTPIKIFGREFSLEKIPGVSASERSFSTFLNQMNLSVYKALCQHPAWGETGPTMEQKKDIAAAVNMMSGYGYSDKGGRGGKLASVLLWAPRLAVSRLGLTTGYDIWGTYLRGLKDEKSMAERNKAARVLAGNHARAMAGQLAATLLLTILLGRKDEDWLEEVLDPASSNFGNVRIGDTNINMTGGVTQWVTLMTRLITGKTVRNGVSKDANRIDTAERFLRGKASPLVGVAWSIMDGKDFTGEPYTAGKAVKDVLFPLAGEDIYEAFRINGPANGMLVAPFIALGAGKSTYQLDEYARATAKFGARLEAFEEAQFGQKIPGTRKRDWKTRDLARARELKEKYPILAKRGTISAYIQRANKTQREVNKYIKMGAEPPKVLLERLEKQKSDVMKVISAS